MYRMGPIISHGLYIFTPFITAVYIVEQLVLQTIYVLNKEILQFLGLKSASTIYRILLLTMNDFLAYQITFQLF